MGGEGERLMIITDELDENGGEIRENGAFRFEKIENNIHDTLFDSWETIITNRIRKAAYALPEILIQHEQSKLGTTSGNAITEAFNLLQRHNTTNEGKFIFRYNPPFAKISKTKHC